MIVTKLLLKAVQESLLGRVLDAYGRKLLAIFRLSEKLKGNLDVELEAEIVNALGLEQRQHETAVAKDAEALAAVHRRYLEGLEEGGEAFSIRLGNIDAQEIKDILNGTYEPTENDKVTVRLFRNAVRRNEDIRANVGGAMPALTTKPLQQSGSHKIGSAIVSQFSERALVFFTPGEGIKSSGGTTVAQDRIVAVNADRLQDAHLGAGHELWHLLRLDRPDIGLQIGRLMHKHIPEVLLEHAQSYYVQKYGPDLKSLEEVAANIFPSVLADPTFWRQTQFNAREDIAKAIEGLDSLKHYYEAALIMDWAAFVKEVAEIFSPGRSSSSFSMRPA